MAEAQPGNKMRILSFHVLSESYALAFQVMFATLNREILEASGLSIGLEANPCMYGIASASTP